MTLQPRDKRALILLGTAALIMLVYRWAVADPAPAVAALPRAESVQAAEKRLADLRQRAALAPAREELRKHAAAELIQHEAGLIRAETAQQVQAQIIQIVRRVGRNEAPPIDIRSTEIGPVRALGAAYGEAQISVTFECRIDQLLNVMAALSAQPELVATSDLRVGAARPKEKTIAVRLTVSGAVPRQLVPRTDGSAL